MPHNKDTVLLKYIAKFIFCLLQFCAMEYSNLGIDSLYCKIWSTNWQDDKGVRYFFNQHIEPPHQTEISGKVLIGNTNENRWVGWDLDGDTLTINNVKYEVLSINIHFKDGMLELQTPSGKTYVLRQYLY